MIFRQDINGLRALAVLIVVLFHFGIPYAQGGFVGVDVFFVISGYLMTGIIVRRLETGKFSLLGFYLDRARRIIPALAALCGVLLLLGGLWLLPTEYRLLGKHVASSISFLSNAVFWLESGYFDLESHQKWLLHTWSLSVEWQFYLLYPLLLLGVFRLCRANTVRWLVLAATLLSFALSVYASSRWASAAFYLLPTRAWEMLVGGIVCLFPLHWQPTPRHAVLRRGLEGLGFGLIIASVLLNRPADIWPGWLALLPVSGAALLVWSARQGSLLTANPLSQWLGTVSYSVYLWHWPVVVVLNYLDKTSDPLWVGAGLLTSALLGAASFRWVETPSRHLGLSSSTTAAVSHRPALLQFAAMVGTVGVLGAGVFALQGLPMRVSPVVRLAEQESLNKNPVRQACFLESGTQSPDCIVGGDGKTVRVIVLGDSHADASVGGVAAAIPPSQTGGALFLGYMSCLSIPGVHFKLGDQGYQCGDYLKTVFARLATAYRDVPIVVINRTSVYVWGHNEDTLDKFAGPLVSFDDLPLPRRADAAYLAGFKQRYVAAMCALAETHPVYLLQPIPEIGVDVPKTLARRLMRDPHAAEVTLDMADYQARHAFTLALMETTRQACPRIHLLDPTPYFCQDGTCFGSQQHRPLYYDNNHLSEHGNRRLTPLFRLMF